jgi:hypothetical protein
MQAMQSVANTARAIVLSVLLDPRAMTALAVVVALAAGLLLGADAAEARGSCPPGGPLP